MTRNVYWSCFGRIIAKNRIQNIDFKKKIENFEKRAFLTIYKKTKKKPGRKSFQTKIFTAFDSPISILLFL